MTAYVTSVQQVSITIGSGSATGTASVTAASGTFFLIYQGNITSATTSNADAFARVSISGTTVTATRAGTGANTCVVNCAVVDATSSLIKSVQMGTISTTTASGTATITSVTTTNSAVCWLGFTQSLTSYHYDLNTMLLTLTNATTVTVNNINGASGTCVTGYCVIEFQGAALNQNTQAFHTTWTNNTGSTTQAVTSVNVNNAMLLFAGGGSGNGDLAADEQPTFQLTSATVVTIKTGNTNSANAQQANFTVVEFIAGVLSQNAQRGELAISSSTTNTATITSATTTNTLLNMTGWRSASTATTNAAIIRPNITQTNATTVTANLNSSGSVTLTYEALTFTAGSSINIDQWLPRYPDAQVPFLISKPYYQFASVDIGVFNTETIRLDKWKPVFVDTVDPILQNYPKGMQTVDIGVFTKETINLDKWKPTFNDMQEPPLVGQPRIGYASVDIGVFNTETSRYDKWGPQYPDKQKPLLVGQPPLGLQTVDIGVFNLETIRYDKWGPLFEDMQTPLLKGQPPLGLQTVDIGVFNAETIRLDKWLIKFPDQQKPYLTGQPKYGFDNLNLFPNINPERSNAAMWLGLFPNVQQRLLSNPQYTVDAFEPDVFELESIDVAKWLPEYPDFITKYIYQNSGATLNMFSFISGSGVTQFFHKRRGQPGTVMRGSHGPGGGQVGQ